MSELYFKTQKYITDSQFSNIPSEIFDLLWFGDGIYKNYNIPVKYKEQDTNSKANLVVVVTNSSYTHDEPSAIYMKLPISHPSPDVFTESPPYSPEYTELSPEQRGKYWDFLANPFAPENDIGYVFLYYYGLERHMLSSNLDKAVDIIIKLRSCYSNNSFQFYTANAIILVCITKNRIDLLQKLINSYEENNFASIPINYLLLLKYKFDIPLTVSEIIRNYQYFGLTNNRYIKNEPVLFNNALSGLIIRDYQSEAINLSRVC